MSAQAYDTVFVINNRKGGFRVREVGEEDELNDYYERKENVVIVPQAEYNSLLEWVDKQLDNCNSHKESFEVCYNDIFNRGQLFTLRTFKEKLTNINTKD